MTNRRINTLNDSEALLEQCAERVKGWITDGHAPDVWVGLEQCGHAVDGPITKLLRSALSMPWSRDERQWAEEVVTALAQYEADQEVLGA